MKSPIRRTTFAGLILLMPYVALAGPPMMGEMIQRLTEELELSADQASQVDAIFSDARSQREAIENNYTLAQRDEARQEMMAIRQNAKQQLEAVLAPEQLEKFEQLRAERRGRFRGKHEGWRHEDHEAPEDDGAI